MWLAFMLMLTIFHHPKAKTFCLASFLALTKKRHLRDGKPHFFFLQESSPNKKFLPLNGEKSLILLIEIVAAASAQRQATHTRKISGRCNFCEGSY
jgi:hypothetical protein